LHVLKNPALRANDLRHAEPQKRPKSPCNREISAKEDPVGSLLENQVYALRVVRAAQPCRLRGFPGRQPQGYRGIGDRGARAIIDQMHQPAPGLLRKLRA